MPPAPVVLPSVLLVVTPVQIAAVSDVKDVGGVCVRCVPLCPQLKSEMREQETA